MSRASALPPESAGSRPGYWSGKLAGRPPALELPSTRARSAQPTTQRTRLAFQVSAELSSAFRLCTERAGMPVFDGLVALWAALLYRTTRQGDLLIGLREDGKYGALRFALEGATSFRALLDTARFELEESRGNALELDSLLKAAHSTRSDNLFQALVTSDKLTVQDAQGYDLVFAPAASARGKL